MEHTFIFIVGVISGFMAPQTWKTSIELSAAGVCFLIATAIAATLSSYNTEKIIYLLFLQDTQTLFSLGFLSLTGVAYACLVAGFTVGIRILHTLRSKKIHKT